MLEKEPVKYHSNDLDEDENYNFMTRNSQIKTHPEINFNLVYLSSKKNARIAVKIVDFTADQLKEKIEEQTSDQIMQVIGM